MIRAWMVVVAGITIAVGVVALSPTRVSHSIRRSATDVSHKSMGTAVNRAVRGVGTAIARHSSSENILLIANNARNSKGPLSLGTAGGQADILVIAHLDDKTHTVTFVSVPRDALIAMPAWRVPIPKIKTVFTVGLQQAPLRGPELEMEYVSRLTGLPIRHYIVTDFQGFVDAIDAIGGLPVHVPARLYDPMHSGVDLRPGGQVLNGRQALAFVRVRQNLAGNAYRVNDYQRQEAEIQVLRILKERLLDASDNPMKVLRLVRTWRRDVATNLTTTELVGYGLQAAGARMETIQLGGVADSMNLASAPLPGVNQWNYLTGAYYDVLNPAEISSQLSALGSRGASLGLPHEPKPSAVRVVCYGAKDMADKLRNRGFVVTFSGPNRTRRTMVFYPPGKIAAAWVVARAMGSSNAWVAPLPSKGGSVSGPTAPILVFAG